MNNICLHCRKQKTDFSYFIGERGICADCAQLEITLEWMWFFKQQSITPRALSDIKDFILKALGKEECVCARCGMKQGKDLVGWTKEYTVCPHCSKIN